MRFLSVMFLTALFLVITAFLLELGMPGLVIGVLWVAVVFGITVQVAN
jgi:hypothetical protein